MYNLIYNNSSPGTAFGGFKSRSEVPPLIDDYEEGKLLLDHYITHRFTVRLVPYASSVET